MTNDEKNTSEHFQLLVSSSGKRRKTDNNKKKKEAEKKTDEKEATKQDERNFKNEYVSYYIQCNKKGKSPAPGHMD